MGANFPPKTISEILDRLDVIREEILSLQIALEKVATLEATQVHQGKVQPAAIKKP